MPPWQNWALAWIVPFGLPRSIYGCGNWVGDIKKTLFAAEQNRPDAAEKEPAGINIWLRSLCVGWYLWMKAGPIRK